MAQTKTKKVTKGGKVYTVTSTDGGKSWTNPKLYSTPKKTKSKSNIGDKIKTHLSRNLQVTGTYLTKGKKAAQDQSKEFRKSDLKIQSESGKTTRSRMEAKQRLTHGDKAINNLKKKNAAWKKMRSGEMSKADFIKKFPNSNTAKKAASKIPLGRRKTLAKQAEKNKNKRWWK